MICLQLVCTVSTYTHKLKGFFLLRAAVFRRAPKQHSIEKVVAAKLHFTDNNLAASIYLDARTNTHTKKIPTWETTNRKPRIGLLFTLYACRKKIPNARYTLLDILHNIVLTLIGMSYESKKMLIFSAT